MSYYVTSFISILHFISDDLIQCDATTRLVELFGDEFDDLDFELALCCFEATHKVAFADRLWETDAEDYEEMTIEEFLENYVDAREQRDPLFVTKRFLMFQESLTQALTEEAEDDQSEDF
jgi:broad specificity phosphatase PhoE